MKAGNQAASGYYAQAANCYAEILKTNKNDDDPLVKPRIKAAKIFVEAAETMATGNIRQAGLLAEKANNLLIRFNAPTNPKAK
jgi:hypothetical protein